MWRKAMLYLGLGPDDEYEDGPGPSPSSGAPVQPRHSGPPLASSRDSNETSDAAVASVRRFPTQPDPRQQRPVARPAVVRSVRPATAVKPVVVAPISFNDAQLVADHFSNDEPVIMNLQGVQRDLSRRLIDFASGLCYGLGGQMERVAVDVFLLTPSKIEVSKEERRRLQQNGLHDTH